MLVLSAESVGVPRRLIEVAFPDTPKGRRRAWRFAEAYVARRRPVAIRPGEKETAR